MKITLVTPVYHRRRRTELRPDLLYVQRYPIVIKDNALFSGVGRVLHCDGSVTGVSDETLIGFMPLDTTATNQIVRVLDYRALH